MVFILARFALQITAQVVSAINNDARKMNYAIMQQTYLTYLKNEGLKIAFPIKLIY